MMRSGSCIIERSKHWLSDPKKLIREGQSELQSSSGGSPSIGKIFCFSDGLGLTRCAFLKVTSGSLGVVDALPAQEIFNREQLNAWMLSPGRLVGTR